MIRNILPLLEILSYLYCFAAVYGKKMKYNIYAVLFAIGEMVIMLGINDYGFPTYIISLSYLLMFLYCMLNYKDTIKTTIVNCLLTFVINGMLQLLCYMAISLIYPQSSNSRVLILEMASSAACFLIVLFLYSNTVLAKVSQFILQRKKLLWAIGIFIFLVLADQVYEMKRNAFLQPDVIVAIVYFIIVLLILVLEWQKTQQDSERRKAQMEVNALYYGAYKGLVQSVREKQHDLKNHMNAISGMIYTIDNYDELVRKQKEYFQFLSNETAETSLLTMIENPLIAGFLTEKIHQAEKKHITVKWECKLTSSPLSVPEYRLVEMMGILMDNAIEKVTRLDTLKRIEVVLKKENELLYFGVTNVCDVADISNARSFFNAGYSSKGKDRGIGLAKLKRMIKEEKGEIAVSEETIEDNPAIRFEFAVPI